MNYKKKRCENPFKFMKIICHIRGKCLFFTISVLSKSRWVMVSGIRVWTVAASPQMNRPIQVKPADSESRGGKRHLSPTPTRSTCPNGEPPLKLAARCVCGWRIRSSGSEPPQARFCVRTGWIYLAADRTGLQTDYLECGVKLQRGLYDVSSGKPVSF